MSLSSMVMSANAPVLAASSTTMTSQVPFSFVATRSSLVRTSWYAMYGWPTLLNSSVAKSPTLPWLSTISVVHPESQEPASGLHVICKLAVVSFLYATQRLLP